MIVHDFSNGLLLLQKYFTSETQIFVIENSTITIEKLRPLVGSDAQVLSMLGWDLSYAVGGDFCVVEYTHIKYMDT